MTDQPLDLAPIKAHHETYRTTWAHRDGYVCCSAHRSADNVPALIAEVERLRAIVRAVQAELASESRAHNQTIADRDDAQSMADKLAAAIAPPEVRGEHSGMNDPWQNALDYAAEAPESYEGVCFAGTGAPAAQEA